MGQSFKGTIQRLKVYYWQLCVFRTARGVQHKRRRFRRPYPRPPSDQPTLLHLLHLKGGERVLQHRGATEVNAFQLMTEVSSLLQNLRTSHFLYKYTNI